MKKIIDESVVKALLAYLLARPYREVCQVIPVLQNLPDATPVGGATPPDKTAPDEGGTAGAKDPTHATLLKPQAGGSRASDA